MMRLLTTATLLLIVATQPGMAATYCRSDIFMGGASFCLGSIDANNFPVRQANGSYWDCDIHFGTVSDYCHRPSDRKQFPVKQSDGSYRNCDINMGKVSFCQGAAEAKNFPVEVK